MKKITLFFGLLLTAQSWAQECDALSYYTEDFESVTVPAIPECATATASGGSNSWMTANNPGNGFENNVLQYSGNANTADAWFFTKGIVMTEGTWYKISYKYGNNSTTTSEDLVVTYGTDTGVSGTVFQTHAGITGGEAQTLSIDFFPAPGTGTYYFGFHANSAASQGNLYLDDIVIEPSTCNTPTGISVSNLTSTSATFSWNATENNNNDSFSVYHYAYMNTNTPPAGPPDLKYEPTTSVNVTDLAPGTTYYLFVRSQCGPVYGDWNEAVTFTTPECAATTVPYSEYFEIATAPELPICIATSEAETGSQWVTANNPGNGFTNNAMEYAGNDEPANAWFFTQGIELTAGNFYKIRYTYGNDSEETSEKLQVVMATSPNAASSIGTISDMTDITGGTAATYTSGIITVPASGVYYFGFNAHSDASQGSLYVDNIEVKDWDCGVPVNVSVSDITTTSATITWETPEENTSLGYLVAHPTENAAPESGEYVTGLTKELTDLAPGTTYYIFVQSQCGPLFGDWSESITFTTPACETTTVPYSLDFESVTAPAIPECTIALDAPTGSNWVTINNPGNEFTSNALVYTGTEEAANAWFFTQGIEITAGTLYKVSYKYGNNSETTTENLRVTLNSNPNPEWIIGNNFATHEGITGGTQSQNSIEYFNLPESGVYYFGFNAYSEAGQGNIYVDDFLIEEIDCGEPTNLQATNVTDTTATITWEAATTGNATLSVYQYYVSTTDTPPTEGENSSELTVNLDELDSETTYYVYVRAQCGPSWSGWESVSFTTDAVAGLGNADLKGLTVYPNPVKDVLNLDANVTIEKVEVYSITGQLVHSENVNSQNTTLNLQKLSAGAYLVNIIGEGQSKRIKIIKE
ncbi:fibronectin type III domain-containing protein [Flavobacterium sp. NRK1]|uniref:fibronectin type III domain-containing protein n=1 Tax=Flavobacterium sp. NRK1 TaxID=2954929 RepID=UPI0020938F77|nr:fibronectin type III domain-containing protein [Flavobacterium sp. NRK1]MCO6146813.1 fibronectin type III domain-containing protein [Flavobacterium sp. NRK1]